MPVQSLVHRTPFLSSDALLLTMLVAKGAVGTIYVFIVQLPLITWNRRFQMGHELAVTYPRMRGFPNVQPKAREARGQ